MRYKRRSPRRGKRSFGRRTRKSRRNNRRINAYRQSRGGIRL